MAQRSVRNTVDENVTDGAPRIEGRRIGVLQLYEEVEGRGDDPGTVADRYDLDVAAPTTINGSGGTADWSIQ